MNAAMEWQRGLWSCKLVPCMERPAVQLTAVSFSVVRVECFGPKAGVLSEPV